MERSIQSFQKYLKRRNVSPNTWRSYTAHLRLFLRWCPKPPEEITHRDVEAYVEHLQGRGLKAKTINDYLGSLKQWFAYLEAEEGLSGPNPVKDRYRLRQPRPLPRPLRQEEVARLFGVIVRPRDRALFLMMLRCGLRVSEVAGLELRDLDLRRRAVTIREAKGGQDRMVYLSDEVLEALVAYLPARLPLGPGPVFLNEKGPWKAHGLSVRGIQKLMEAYGRKSALEATCHRLRHTFATQLLNAEADLVAIQELLGHRWITTTQRYCRVSNRQVKQAYFRAVRNIETRDPPSWLDPTPSWQPLTVGVHSLRGHPVT